MTEILHHPLWIRLGLTLAHFVWQGALVALLAAVLLAMLRRRSPQTRYALATGALLFMLACPVITLRLAEWTSPAVPVESTSLALIAVPEAAPVLLEGGWTAPVPPLESYGGPTVVESVPTPTPAASVAPDEPAPAISAWHAPRPEALALCLSISAGAWLLCVAVLALRLMAGWIALRRWRTAASPALPPGAAESVARIAQALGLTARVQVLVSERAPQPLAFGILRPVVLLPVSVVTELPLHLLEAMIAHELAHIRRYDLWVNVLQRIIETLLFYHPGVWWVSGRVRLERELCCDDLAVRATGQRVDYAEALVALARQGGSTAALALSAGMLGGRTTLGDRVRRILQLPQPLERRRAWMAGPITLVLLVAITAAGRTRTTEADDVSVPAETVVENAMSQPAVADAPRPAPRLLTVQTTLADDSPDEEQLREERLELHKPAEAARQFTRFIADVLGRGTPTTPPSFMPWEVTEYQLMVTQVREDLAALGLTRYAAPSDLPWRVREVVWAEPPPDAVMEMHSSKRLVICERFDDSSGKAPEGLVVSCIMQRTSGWPGVLVPARLAVLPANQEQEVRERLFRTVLENPALNNFGGSFNFKRVTFRDGYPMERQVLPVIRRAEGSAVVQSEHLEPPTAFSEVIRRTRYLSPGEAAPAASAEGRTFTFSLRSVPLKELVETFGTKAGLPVAGFDLLREGDLQLPVTLESTRPWSFDEALLALNKALFERQLWALPRDGALMIRPVTDWYRYIPADHFFLSEQAWRDAALPEWDVASVVYRPKSAPPERLITAANDLVPMNAARAALSEDGSSRLSGFVHFINEQLRLLARLDFGVTPPAQPRDFAPPASPRIPVRSLAEGIVTEVKVGLGQSVKKGQPLVQLDDQEIRLELKAAEERVRSAERELQLRKAHADRGLSGGDLVIKAESDLTLARLDLERWSLRLARTQIESPADGVVAPAIPPRPGDKVMVTGSPDDLRTMVGRRVAAGDTLMTIVTAPAASQPEASAERRTATHPAGESRTPTATPPAAQSRGIYYVLGGVLRPGAYALPKEGAVTLRQAIAAAGGLDGARRGKHAELVRRDGEKANTLPLDLDAILAGKASDPDLQAGDLVTFK